jgi:hypothetical protein
MGHLTARRGGIAACGSHYKTDKQTNNKTNKQSSKVLGKKSQRLRRGGGGNC